MINRSLALRSIRPDDEAFLYEVYASTRVEEAALANWTKTQQQTFLKMQFSAQHEYYQAVYPGADFQIILLEGQPVGRLYVAHLSKEVRIIDFALLPHFRNRGIGTHLLTTLLAEAGKTGKAVTIHIEKFNPTLSLYQRLGFTKTLDKGLYYCLEWTRDRSTMTA